MNTDQLPHRQSNIDVSGCTVLFVDDDPNVLHSLVRTLRQQPFRICTAHSADEAKEVLKGHAVDLIVSDEKMPGICGSDLLAWVAEKFPHVVRIVLTGQPDVPSALSAINEGHVYRYLTKPCDAIQLALAIRCGLEERLLHQG